MRNTKAKRDSPPVPTEREVLRAILEWLRMEDLPVWRLNSGIAWQRSKSGVMPVRLAPKGTPDLGGWIPNTRSLVGDAAIYAVPLFIEVKRPMRSPNDQQRQWGSRANDEGCVWIWTTCVEDLRRQLSAWVRLRST